jgi:hypothetical protein
MKELMTIMIAMMIFALGVIGLTIMLKQSGIGDYGEIVRKDPLSYPRKVCIEGHYERDYSRPHHIQCLHKSFALKICNTDGEYARKYVCDRYEILDVIK